MIGSLTDLSDRGEGTYETVALRTLNAFAVDVMTIPNSEDLFWYVAQNVVGRLKFVDCVIYQANTDQTELVQVAAMGEKNPFGRSIINPLKIPFGEGITGRVAQTREPIIVDDLLEDQNYIADTQPARSEICVPMVFGNRVVGVIDSEHPDIGAFGDTELEILITVAAMTTAKLELLAEAERSSRRYYDLVHSHNKLTEEINNRKALEAKLFEARKLESIGRLAGGLAHNFNSLLTVVSEKLQLLEKEVTSSEAKGHVTEARSAATSAAKLVDDTLAFSQKSNLKPEQTDLDTLVAQVAQTAELIFSDRTELALSLSKKSWSVEVDVSATKSALLNLMINAHQAMSNGGKLVIGTENLRLTMADIRLLSVDLTPGNYVCVSLQDNGAGIPLDRLHKIFDPFFSTKSSTAGSGLGLSTVLGFMKQSGGTVAVGSSAGQGTTFRLYFPASKTSLAAVK
ncbi:MAG: ATP-binding protein [Pseudomonadota bacterium]